MKKLWSTKTGSVYSKPTNPRYLKVSRIARPIAPDRALFEAQSGTSALPTRLSVISIVPQKENKEALISSTASS
jgi:hypothetical protein